MWAFAKAVLLLARYARRIAKSLEGLEELYELDLGSRDIFRVSKDLQKEERQVEISYEVKERAPGELDPDYN